MNRDVATMLLRRAMDDPGPKGTVALNMLRDRLKGVEAQVYVIDDGTHDPLLFVVRDYIQRLKESEDAKVALRDECARIGVQMERLVKRLRAVGGVR